jgi:hypothetical protein
MATATTATVTARGASRVLGDPSDVVPTALRSRSLQLRPKPLCCGNGQSKRKRMNGPVRG